MSEPSDFRDPARRQEALAILQANGREAFRQFRRGIQGVIDVLEGSYCPPIETVCKTCGGKHVGQCSLNACSDVGRGSREVM